MLKSDRFQLIYNFTIIRLVTMFPEVGAKMNLKILRAIRVLRPLKLVSRVPSM